MDLAAEITKAAELVKQGDTEAALEQLRTCYRYVLTVRQRFKETAGKTGNARYTVDTGVQGELPGTDAKTDRDPKACPVCGEPGCTASHK